jgi:hypothetical protein
MPLINYWKQRLIDSVSLTSCVKRTRAVYNSSRLLREMSQLSGPLQATPDPNISPTVSTEGVFFDMTATTTILLLLLIAILWMLTALYQYHLLDVLQVGEMKMKELRLTRDLSLVLVISRTDDAEISYQVALIRY